jgi:hypothetical protein
MSMDKLMPLDVGVWKMLLAPKSLRPQILTLIAGLTDHAPLLVFDGGNQFNAFRVARLTHGRPEILKRIKISRAFTCYQMLSLLEGINPIHETILLLDFLATLYDESASFPDRTRLLALSLSHIRKLSLHNGLLVTVHPPAITSPESESLIAQLTRQADGVWTLETPVPPLATQPALF